MQQDVTDVPAYLAQFPEPVREKLARMRHVVLQAAPEAEEMIRYAMPTYKVGGKTLIHFAAFKKHLGLYPGPSTLSAFAGEIARYKSSKGALQFPIDEEPPLRLIERIVHYRLMELGS